MTQLSQAENALVVELTKKASQDTNIVKTLTLVTLVYLPASFAAVSAVDFGIAHG